MTQQRKMTKFVSRKDFKELQLR